jgi:hypothetical protein
MQQLDHVTERTFVERLRENEAKREAVGRELESIVTDIVACGATAAEEQEIATCAGLNDESTVAYMVKLNAAKQARK